MLLQTACRSHEGSAGAKSGDEVGDLSLGLTPYLRRGRLVVGAPVGVVAVLVGVVKLITKFGCHFTGLADRPVGAVGGVRGNDLGAVSGENLLALGRDVGRHAEGDAKI